MSILHKFDASECDIWFCRFGLDFTQKVVKYFEILILEDVNIYAQNVKILSVGNAYGKIYIWSLDEEDLNNIK